LFVAFSRSLHDNDTARSSSSDTIGFERFTCYPFAFTFRDEPLLQSEEWQE
jgi:hypothetical protein